LIVKDRLQRIKEFLFGRKVAYAQVFSIESRAGNAVMKDLAKFCRAYETTFNPDPRIHGVLEGRREVWLRIQSHINLSEEQLWTLYGKDNS